MSAEYGYLYQGVLRACGVGAWYARERWNEYQKSISPEDPIVGMFERCAADAARSMGRVAVVKGTDPVPLSRQDGVSLGHIALNRGGVAA